MRTDDLIKSFINNTDVGRGKASSASVVGDKLFSYNTVIAQREDGHMLVNMTKYSSTTTRQQNLVMKYLEERGIPRHYIMVRVDVGTQSLIGLEKE